LFPKKKTKKRIGNGYQQCWGSYSETVVLQATRKLK